MEWLVIILFAFIVAKVFSLFVFPKIMERWFTLKTQISSEEGFVAVNDCSAFMGQEGVTVTDLKPSGKANLGNERMDVLSERDFIPRGTKIKVVKVNHGTLIVQVLKENIAPDQNS